VQHTALDAGRLASAEPDRQPAGSRPHQTSTLEPCQAPVICGPASRDGDDTRHGPVAVEYEDFSTTPNVLQIARQVVSKFANFGFFHMAILAILTEPGQSLEFSRLSYSAGLLVWPPHSNTTLSLAPDVRLGAYEIAALIGAGGMGPTIAFGTPADLPRGPRPGLLSGDIRGYDVLKDGRFVSLSQASAADGLPSAPRNEIRVVLTLV
jgi:hypothetical protein